MCWSSRHRRPTRVCSTITTASFRPAGNCAATTPRALRWTRGPSSPVGTTWWTTHPTGDRLDGLATACPWFRLFSCSSKLPLSFIDSFVCWRLAPSNERLLLYYLFLFFIPHSSLPQCCTLSFHCLVCVGVCGFVTLSGASDCGAWKWVAEYRITEIFIKTGFGVFLNLGCFN